MKSQKGKLFVVGLGPGDRSQMTMAVINALEQARVIVGYKTYLELIPGILKDKMIISSGMRGENQRVDKALEAARKGETVAIVSSGDAGIYGMAGLVLERMKPDDEQFFDIDILPGISAASAAASLIGAPLMNDFVVISLSDLLTPRELILKRLEAAVLGDFVTVLYNPRSKSRTDLIQKAFQIFREKQKGTTPVAIVKQAYRKGQKIILTNLAEIDNNMGDIDMFSIVIIGNSYSFFESGRFITQRGYAQKAERIE